jgi:hypothetical protein
MFPSALCPKIQSVESTLVSEGALYLCLIQFEMHTALSWKTIFGYLYESGGLDMFPIKSECYMRK